MAWTAPVNFAEPQIVDETDLNLMQDNIRESWHEVAYVEFTATVTGTGNVETAPVDVVSAGAITFVANPIVIQFYAPSMVLTPSASETCGISLWDGTDLGRLAVGTLSNSRSGSVYVERRLTPTAASHTYKVRIWANIGGSAASSSVTGGAGGVGTNMPGFIRVLQRGG
jgi:hypothetical protein